MYDKELPKREYLNTSRSLLNKELNELNIYKLDAVIANVIKRKVISNNFDKALNLYSEQKIAIYFSIEFLMGRIVLDSLTNAGLKKLTTKIFLEE